MMDETPTLRELLFLREIRAIRSAPVARKRLLGELTPSHLRGLLARQARTANGLL
nr:hypothetical protein [Citromicrobium sp. JL2201]